VSKTPKHILFISSWYPTPEKKSHGIFFKRHAEAAALINKISAIHIYSGNQYHIDIKKEQEVFTILGTYKKVTHKIPVLATLQKLWRSLQCFKNCYKTLVERQSAPDLLLLNIIFPAGILVLWLHFFKRIPFIIQEQWSGYYPEDGNYKGFFIKKISSLCVKHAKGILVVSDKLEQSMRNHGLQNKYIKIGNVVDTDLFKPLPPQAITPFKFIHVSTVNDKEKNITGMIEAAHFLSQKNISYRLDIIGDGPERQNFEALAQQYQLLNKVIFFHGFELPPQVAKMMAEAHCFILNSNYEGLPCVLLEAMSCGIPVIATKVGAVPEIINYKQGILIEVNQSKDLMQAMEDMISGYKSYDTKEIRAIVQRKYSYPALAAEFDTIFTAILAEC
jgi:glycosyltransferase involved in cell wall biosynthesis